MSNLAWLEALERNKGQYPLSGVSKPRTQPIKGVVVHHTEGAPSLSGNLSWARQKKVGADAYILPDGSFVRGTAPDQRMDHAGIKNISEYGNNGTFSIEIITTADGMPNAAQLKTTHGLVSNLSAQHGFDIKKDVVAHGDIAPGHKNSHEGAGFVRMVRERGALTGDGADIDYDSYAKRFAGNRPIMKPEVHPVDLGKGSRTGYDPHGPTGNGERFQGDLTLDRRNNEPAHFRSTQEINDRLYPDPEPIRAEVDPNYRTEQDPIINDDGVVQGTTVDPGFLTGVPDGELGGTELPPAPTTAPVATYESGEPVAKDMAPTPGANPFGAGKVAVNPVALIPSDQDAALPESTQKAFAESRAEFSHPDLDKYIEGRKAVEVAATQDEQAQLFTPPMAPNINTQMSVPEEMRARALARDPTLATPLLAETLKSAPKWTELLEADFITRNSLVNTIQSGAQLIYRQMRDDYDPSFTVPTEQLRQFPEQYHGYLRQSANAHDYVFREYEIKSRMEAEQVAQRAYDNHTGMWFTSYMTSGVVTMLPYMATGTVIANTGARAAGFGASYLTRLAHIAPAEMALATAEGYVGVRGGIHDETVAGFIMAATFAGSAVGARFIQNPKLRAEVMEANEKLIEQELREISERTGTPIPEREADAMDSVYRGRPIIDEDASIEVLRPAMKRTDRAVLENLEADREFLTRHYTEIVQSQPNTQFSKKVLAKLDEVFERQKHVLEKDRSAFIVVPKKYAKNPEEYLSVLEKKGDVVVGHRNASEIISNVKGGAVIRFELPKGTRVIDMGKYAKGKKGSFAFRTKNIVPGKRAKTGGKGVNSLIKGPDTFGFESITKKLTRSGKPVLMKNGEPVPLYQTTARIGRDTAEKTEPSAELKKQWIAMRAGGRDASVSEVMRTNASKAKHGDDSDTNGPFWDLHEDWFKADEVSGNPGNLSAGATAASQAAPVVRNRLANVSTNVQTLMKEQQMFAEVKDTDTLANSIPILNWASPTGMKALKDENFYFRNFMRQAVELGFNSTSKELDAGKGHGVTMDRLAVEIISAMDGRVMKAAIPNFNKYLDAKFKAEGKTRVAPNMFRNKSIKEFNREVYEYRSQIQAGVEPPEPEFPGIKEYAEAQDKIYSDMYMYAHDPGLWIGRPRLTETLEDGSERIISGYPALEGFEEPFSRAGHTPRNWIGEYISNAEERFGSATVHADWLHGAMKTSEMFSDEEFIKFAHKKIGYKGPKDKIPEDMRLKAEAVRDNHIRKVADLVSDKIKRSKSGNNIDLELVAAASSGRKFVELLKKEFIDQMDPDFVDTLDNILWKGTVKNPDGTRKKITAGGSGKHSHHRLPLNERFVLNTSKGHKVKITDFVQSDATQNIRGYIRRMGGRIAWGTFDYVSPGGGVVIKGINSDGAFRKVMQDMMDIDTNLAKEGRKFIPLDRKTNVQEEMEALWAHTTGNTPVGTPGLQLVQSLSYAMHLGNAGFAQASEMSNMLGKVSLGYLTDVQEWKSFVKAIKQSRGGTQLDKRESLDGLGMIMEDDLGLSTDLARGALGNQADERMGLGEGLGTAGYVVDRAARWVFITSGLAPLQQEMQRTMALGIFHRLTTASRRNASFETLNRRSKQELVEMVGDNVMAERVFNLMKNEKFTKTEKRYWGNKVTDFDQSAKDFDAEAFHALKHGVKRFTEQGIQNNSYGTMHRWFNDPRVRAFMTLKSFLYGSYTKQLIRHMREIATYSAQAGRDIAAGGNKANPFNTTDGLGDSLISLSGPVIRIIANVGLGAALYMAMEERKLLGASEEKAEKRREKLYSDYNLANAGIIRSGTLGIIPTLYNTPMQAFNPEWTWGQEGFKGSGLDATLTSIPAISQSWKAVNLAGQAAVWALDGAEGGMTQKQLDRTKSLISNTAELTTIVNVIGSQLELDNE